MKALDRITVCNEARQHELGKGRLAIGDNYARIHVPGAADAVLPDQDIHAMDVVASCSGSLLYAGSVWDVEETDTHMGSKVVLRCLPAEAHT